MLDIIGGFDYSEGANYSDELMELFNKYNDEWIDSDFTRLGKRVSMRVILWDIGFQMTCEQLGICS